MIYKNMRPCYNDNIKQEAFRHADILMSSQFIRKRKGMIEK